MTLESLSFLVEQSIVEIGKDPVLSRGDKPGQWTISYKGSTVWIDIFNFPDNPNRYYFQVMSPLLRVPDRNHEEIFRNILEINHNLYGSWISIKDNWMYVLNLRESDNLDQSEIVATLDRVAFYSNDYYGKLSFKYEGSWDKRPTDNPISNN
ncbi:MAG: YbjN domain-containing protein [Bacteroidia bacterium]|nr:YbjN domain-containing protein [Bacteroidia bacterium]MCZ2248396.1 YbjN domain-containing protein [Bacteroidia bacterium]